MSLYGPYTIESVVPGATEGVSIVVVRSARLHISQVWCPRSSGTRITHDCAICNKKIPVGSFPYSPLTNTFNRGERICEPCVQKWLAASGGQA